MPLRKIAIARLTSPFILFWVDSFRDVYARTGMNLAQSLVVVVVGMVQMGWRALNGPASGHTKRQA